MKKPKPTKLDCGCIHSAAYWLAMCDEHQREYDATHTQANVDYQRAMELASGKLQPCVDSAAAEKRPPAPNDGHK